LCSDCDYSGVAILAFKYSLASYQYLKRHHNQRNSFMAARLGNFIIFLILTVITLGIYPLYFFVTRQQENTELLKEIRDELKKGD
jgi:NADH:ubiquinone oxidoreductase subunit 4 (subunit M)